MTTHLCPIAAALLMVCGSAWTAAAQTQETEEVNRTIPFHGGGTLRLKNFSGDIRITGSDAGEVAIHAVRRATRERLDRIKLTIEESGSTIHIRANDRADGDDDNDNVVETSFEIRVPRSINLDIHAFSSTITIDDVEGRQAVHTFSGDIRLTGVRGPLRAETFSGDVELLLPQHAGADIQLNSFSGDLRTDLPVTFVSRSRRNVHATVNGGGEDVRVKTFSGDVRLGTP